MEEMETVIKKQGHGLNDLEFLIDQARDTARTSAEYVENAISKFDTKLEVSSGMSLLIDVFAIYSIILCFRTKPPNSGQTWSICGLNSPISFLRSHSSLATEVAINMLILTSCVFNAGWNVPFR